MRRSRLLGVSAAVAAVAFTVAGVTGCRDLSGFSTGSGSFQGQVVPASFILSGIGGDGGTDVSLCLTLDTDHLQDAPGAVSTSDGVFSATTLRPIPQLWQDPLSTFNFGEGRTKNLLYIATPQPGSGNTADVTVIISLMASGDVEVRLLRGAPSLSPEGGTPSGSTNLFAVFTLTKQPTPCPF
jgi:hypothetical protein